MKDLYFKVKKIECRGSVYTGIVLPYFEQRSWNWVGMELKTDMVEFVTLNGEKMKFRKGAKFQITRITDKKVKDLIDETINMAKEEYKLKMSMIDLNKQGEALLLYSEKKNKEVTTKISEIIKCQGLLTNSEFIEKLNSCITCGYKIEYVISNSRLLKIKLEKQHDLGHWIKEGKYSFLFLEYDDNVCVCDNYKDDKQLKDIKSKYFKNLTTNKVSGYSIKEDFRPHGGGDKRSACVCQDFEIELKNGIELKQENISKVLAIFKDLFANLK
jgi:hypothetical protein